MLIPVLAAAGRLEDDNCKSLDPLVPYQRRGKDIGVTVEPLGYRTEYRERVQRPALSQMSTVASLKPKLRVALLERV